MLKAAVLVDLALYAVVVSQPLFYLLALTGVSRSLSAPAYIELRQHINALMNRRVPLVYVATLAATVTVLVCALRSADRAVAATSAIAIACLFVDVIFMVRANVPLNGVMDSWSPAAYPEDWQRYRERWFEIFAYRQLALFVGFLSLLAGTVFRA